MNDLYWYKDSFKVSEQVDYLEMLLKLARELNLEGLQTEIKDYLLILEKQ